MQELVVIKNISKHYGKQKALDKVSFAIKKGEILGLVGQNGAGKTTLIRVLSGLINKDEGEVIQGSSYKIGAIIESPILYLNMSAFDNLMYSALQMGISEAEKRIKEVLGLVGLADVDNKKKVKDFSLGMRQRMAIALAILDFPDFLILDEPINGLDPSGIKEMREIIHSLRDRYGITILISSHILSELELVVDRFVIMHKGKVIKDIEKTALRAEVEEKIFLGTKDNKLAQQVLSELGLTPMIQGDLLVLSPELSVQEIILSLLEKQIEITDIYHAGGNFENYYLSLLD